MDASGCLGPAPSWAPTGALAELALRRQTETGCGPVVPAISMLRCSMPCRGACDAYCVVFMNSAAMIVAARYWDADEVWRTMLLINAARCEVLQRSAMYGSYMQVCTHTRISVHMHAHVHLYVDVCTADVRGPRGRPRKEELALPSRSECMQASIQVRRYARTQVRRYARTQIRRYTRAHACTHVSARAHVRTNTIG